MKIEYVEKSSNGAVIRLFDFSNAEVAELKELLEKLVNGQTESVAVHEHCHVNPNDNCHLTFFLSDKDLGIIKDNHEFNCSLTASTMSNIIEPLASFALHPIEFKGYEWLDETSQISLLISPNLEP